VATVELHIPGGRDVEQHVRGTVALMHAEDGMRVVMAAFRDTAQVHFELCAEVDSLRH